jgi:16S rRNA (guanine527-N7)-methyltransferase
LSIAGRNPLESALGPVSRETFERLDLVEKLFGKWAARMNLAAPSTLGDVWLRHIVDSAQIFPYAGNAEKWVDLGSGGGFPGLVLAVLLCERPGSWIDLVESNRKKSAFLQMVAGQLGLPVTVHTHRIEDVVSRLGPRDIVTARALAPLPLLLELAAPLLTAGSRGLFHKGRDYRREVEESSERWTFDLVEHASVVESDSVILDISNLRRRQA